MSAFSKKFWDNFIKNFPFIAVVPSASFFRPIGKNWPSFSLFPESKVILETNNKLEPSSILFESSFG